MSKKNASKQSHDKSHFALTRETDLEFYPLNIYVEQCSI